MRRTSARARLITAAVAGALLAAPALTLVTANPAQAATDRVHPPHPSQPVLPPPYTSTPPPSPPGDTNANGGPHRPV